MKFQRVITGVIIFLVYAGVLTLSLVGLNFAFDIFTVALMVGAGFEMSKAISNRYSKTYDQLILFNILLGYLVFVLVTRFKNSGGITSYFGVLFLVVIACAIYTMFSKKKTISNATGTILTLIYPISLFIYMLGINYFESPYRIAGLFFVFVIPCLTDTFAYMIGSLFKGPKLCPSVSPNKTISGAVGGLVGGLLGGAMLLLLATYGIFGLAPIGGSTVTNVVHYLTIGFCGAFFVQVGDLLASYVKRNCGIKDFGKVLPGHGGFMDRVDGMVVFSVFLFIYLNVLSAL
ncbi:MAG: phosphatidate cytidylyltransferase [Clostridia bacterium]|nr:phosphatidate cytidylyltransferase [Clostridia bacterium]